MRANREAVFPMKVKAFVVAKLLLGVLMAPTLIFKVKETFLAVAKSCWSWRQTWSRSIVWKGGCWRGCDSDCWCCCDDDDWIGGAAGWWYCDCDGNWEDRNTIGCCKGCCCCTTKAELKGCWRGREEDPASEGVAAVWRSLELSLLLLLLTRKAAGCGSCGLECFRADFPRLPGDSFKILFN